MTLNSKNQLKVIPQRPVKRTSNNSIRRRNGRNDVLDDALRQRPCDAFDVELFRTGQRALVQPLDVIRVVVVKFLVCNETVSRDLWVGYASTRERTFELLWPFENTCPFDTVLWHSRGVGDRTYRIGCRRRKHVNLANCQHAQRERR